MNEGYVMLRRNGQTRELIKDPKAFALLTLIACRAKRTDDFNVYGLKPGQALIGDRTSHGLTAKEYRNAKARLKRYGLVDFRPTNKGTIATLLDASVYDINVQELGPTSGRQRTGEGQPEGNPGATNKNDKKDKNEMEAASSSRTPLPRTFEEMDRERAQRALAQARQEFLADE